MYNSQYYTCEQIDQRLLQGYLDDYNTENGTSLTKAQFLQMLSTIIGKSATVDNLIAQLGYYICDTASGTAAKILTVAGYELFNGGSIKVKFINKNTANNATLNINSQGAKALYYQGERASATNSWDAEEVVEIYYDGTSYYANNVNGGSGSGVYDVSKEHPTSGPNSDGKFTLEYILNPSNVNELIPVNKRYPGMSIQFVSTYDNKYVQYRLMSDSFNTTITNWQGVDDEPTAGSDNLIRSGGVYEAIAPLGYKFLELNMDSCKEPGTYNTNGEYITSNYRRITPYIEVKKGDIFDCYIRQEASTFSVVVFDIEKEIILSACVAGNCMTSFVVPDGASYLRFSCSINHLDTFKVSRHLGFPFVQKKGQSETEAMSQKAVTDELTLINTYKYTFIGEDADINGAYNTSGEYRTTDYRNITIFIPVKVGDIFECSLNQNANDLSIAAFDSSKQIILASSVSGNRKGTYIVPEGVSFVRFGCVSTYTDSFNVVKEFINKSNLSLCTGTNYIDFDNFAKKLYITTAIQVKYGGNPITLSGDFEISYDWTTTSSQFVRLYYDLSDSTLKFGYYRTDDKNPTIAVLRVSGTESADLKVLRVLSCALPYTIDGLREDQLPPVTITKHIKLASDDFKHPHRYSNTGEMNRSNYRRMTDYYKVLQGQKFQCVLDQGTQNDLSVIAFDSDLNVLTDKSYSGDINGVYTVQTGVSYLRFGCSSTGAASASVEEIEKWQEEIDEVANGVLIPDYFDNQVSSQIANASNDIVEANINGDNFIFITDIHWERNNRNAPALIRHICDEMTMSQVVFGGDAIDGQAQQSVAISYFNAIAKIKGADSNFLAAFGNHDANSLAGGTAFSPYNIAFYSLMQKPADRISVHNNSNITNYYIDNPTTNTRYIVLDTRTNHAFSTATSNWLTSVITDTTNDMHIIIVLHSYMYTTTIYDGSTVIGYDGAISTAGTSLNSILSNFTTKKIEAVFSGHMHMDYNGMTDNMIPVVVNDCDSKATSMWENVDGTVNGQSFDIVTVNYTTKLISCRRIGRGKSRLIHYTPYTLNVGETLDISSLLTIVPTSYSTRDNMLSHYLKSNPVPKTTFYSNNATISNAGIVTAVAAGYVTAVAENDDFIETFNIKIS